MTRLSQATLASLPAAIRRPAYPREAITPGIVHIGIGAFHRAHQAAMTEACLNAGARAWGIIAASLRSADTRDALEPQDGLYTLGVRDGSGTRFQVMGAVSRVLVAPEDPEALLSALCLPSIRIVSLTISEKGYCLDPATGQLNETHPDIVHDRANPARPRTAPGFISEAIRRRRAAGLPAFTVLCCDNLPSNGETVRGIVARFAALVDPNLGAFIAREIAFPSTMVDRIVPATTDADRDQVATALGVSDHWPVLTEPFLQWVIEDRFPAGRPDWALAGAEFVRDVAPYELMKLRMLNGAHSTLAYLGVPAGLTFVADAASDAGFSRLLQAYWAEVAPTLPEDAGLDAAAYARRLQERFENPEIRHRLQQIAMDGSQKLPQRLVNSLRQRRNAGLASPVLSLSIAGFLHFMSGRDAAGNAFPINDPMAAIFAERLVGTGDDAAAIVSALMGISAVFGDLAGDPGVTAPIIAALRTIQQQGPRAAISAVTG